MKDKKTKPFNPNLLLYYTIVIMVVWSIFVLCSLLWHKKVLHSGALEAAKIEARAAFQNHVIYRSWNAGHGGLYAPVTDATRPNPYLEVPEREIQTPSGVWLTKINPSSMTRQVNELALEHFKYIGHITSLNPIRAENRADEWETHALKLFEQGVKEFSSLEIINDAEHMRLMRPLITTKGCLKCHEKQGYKINDIRGGISVAVPTAPHLAIEKANFKTFKLIYGFLWFSGLLGTCFFMSILNRQIHQRFKAENELRHREKMEGVLEMARAVCHELNQPLQMIMGNSEILMLGDIDEKTLSKRMGMIQEQVDRMGKMTRKLMQITDYKTKDMPQGKVIDIDESAK